MKKEVTFAIDEEKHDEFVKREMGKRELSGKTSMMLSLLAFFWSLYQVWVASPLQYWVAQTFGWQVLVFDEVKVRTIHLSIGLVFAFTTFPAFSFSHRKKVPWSDLVFSLLACSAVLYNVFFYREIVSRIGMPNHYDVIAAVLGICLLIEAARRVVGAGLVVLVVLFLFYAYFGQYMPEVISHKGKTLSAIVSHQWLSTEGVFGVALGVSAGFVYLYVLFGMLLDKAGAGSFFISLAFALLGRFRGGVAKASIVASGLMGMFIGSSMANTITVGIFTIPLMKRSGFSAEKAGAIEVSAGINGQIMPPVMGAAAFLMTEFLGIPYADVMRHAILPALLIYIALLYIVHLEALMLGLKPLRKKESQKVRRVFLRNALVLCSWFIVFSVAYFLFGVVREWSLNFFAAYQVSIFSYFCGAVGGSWCVSFLKLSLIYLGYLGVLFWQSKRLKPEHVLEEYTLHPEATVKEIMQYGVHYFIPILILVWCLVVEKMSPSFSAYWSIVFLLNMLITYRPFMLLFMGVRHAIKKQLVHGCVNCYRAMTYAGRNMVTVAVATATAGMIVGTISLTGIGQNITDVVITLAGGHLLGTLILTALFCLVLGMGMPTTACYIIVSNLMVPVIHEIMMIKGYDVPSIALHLFVFYFGVLADVTPPVGIAAYAASAISGGNPVKTCVQGFVYNIRTMILPFMFIFNTELILWGDFSLLRLVVIYVTSILGVLTLTAALQGYFVCRTRFHETLVLLVAAIALLHPHFWLDRVKSPFYEISMEGVIQGRSFSELVPGIDSGVSKLRLSISDYDLAGEEVSYISLIPFDLQVALEGNILRHLESLGATFVFEEGALIVSDVAIGSPLSKKHIHKGAQIQSIEVPVKQPNKLYVVALAMCLLVVIGIQQRKRHRKLNTLSEV